MGEGEGGQYVGEGEGEGEGEEDVGRRTKRKRQREELEDLKLEGLKLFRRLGRDIGSFLQKYLIVPRIGF